MELNGLQTVPLAELCVSRHGQPVTRPTVMLNMNLEGLEMIAVLVVVVVFVKVLEQFGLLEAGYDGKIKEKKKCVVYSSVVGLCSSCELL